MPNRESCRSFAWKLVSAGSGIQASQVVPPNELLPVCLERNIAVIAGGVYNSGILAGPRPGSTFDYLPAPSELIMRADRLNVACARHSVPLKAAAIQFPMGHPGVAAVLIGCRSTGEVDENIRMFRHEIPVDLWKDLRQERLIPEGAPIPGTERPGA